MNRSGIVLAGGASRRFGGDKLAEPVGGISLLERAVQALAGVVDEILVVVGPNGRAPVPGLSDREGLRIVGDREPFGGPVAGIQAGLLAARGELVLVVGGDMPSLVPDVLDLLAESAPAALADSAGVVRPLPCAFDRAAGIVLADELLAGGERRLRTLLARLGARAVPWSEWQPRDPAGATLVDIDERGDLP